MTESVDVLSVELATYERHREMLLRTAPGMYALVKGDEILDLFECEEDAIEAGYERLGNVPFLVKRIIEVEQPLWFPPGRLAL